MTSSDVRDVLNLPDSHAGPRPAKKQKTSAPRPNLKGLAREVQNLGGDNPIAIVPEVSIFKKRRFVSRKPATKWELKPFTNSARGDSGALVLKHWKRKIPTPAENAAQGADEEMKDADGDQATSKPENSMFAKFNVEVDVPQYSEDQYQTNLQSDDWTKEETDYLLSLVRDFDLRWPIIWDRYDYMPEAINGEASADGDESKAIIPVPKPRTMEDLKARYYEVAAKMMAVQKPVQYMTQPEYTLHELMANFNANQEKLRKDFANNALTRSKEEAKEEESLLLEIKRILARSDRFNEERRELYNRLDYPHTDQDISTFKSSAGLQTLLQNLMNADKSKKRKSLMAADGVSPSTPAAGQQPAAAASDNNGNRRESIAAAAAAATAPPEKSQKEPPSSVAQTPTAPAGGKKGQQQQERRKLSEAEMHVYGVTHHDRLSSGPTFRYERINKLFTHKSNQQQLRIMNTLNELDIPPRLVMPTAPVTSQYELLLGAVNSLLDARKVTDKIDAEIKIELAKKMEREKTNQPEPNPAAEKKEGDGDSRSTEEKKDKTVGGEAKAEAAPAEPAKTDEPKTNGGAAGAEAPADGEREVSASAATEEGKGDADKDKDKPARPGSSGVSHKRSASVMSAGGDDKTAKRQKK
ncbi:Putative SWR1-complex protein 4/DNA methyltransferase 1-associated protein [Colletotrichum destructivum]|uniref:SWR1-complex protein 4 n=1 Tax=Colletotrichum destructivum TaxID=34406 RepID=A0AAX4J0U1_9PEZI|nr:Putative SWR1-complex protein 4/DNA methyltransferase 1-associated protein [Colletotrichum destructivum]